VRLFLEFTCEVTYRSERLIGEEHGYDPQR